MKTRLPYHEPEVLRRISEGEEPAFRELYDHYRNKIYTMAFRVTGSEAVAHDVIQDIFVKIWVARAELTQVKQFNAWLNTVVRHHLSNRFRRLAIENTYLKNLLDGNHEGVREQVSDPVLYQEIMNLHKEAIDHLPPQQRKVYLMGKRDGLKYEEIAAELHISKDTVKDHMMLAMRSVRQHLTHHEYELILAAIATTSVAAASFHHLI